MSGGVRCRVWVVRSRSTVLWSGYSNGAMVAACHCDELIVPRDVGTEDFL